MRKFLKASLHSPEVIMDAEDRLLILSLTVALVVCVFLIRLCYTTLPLHSADFVMVASVVTLVSGLVYFLYFHDNF